MKQSAPSQLAQAGRLIASAPCLLRLSLACVALLAGPACKSTDPSPADLTAPPAGALTAQVYAPASVLAYAAVILDGSYSSDPSAAITSYAWQQTAGPAVALTGAASATPSFVAPAVASATPLTFTLTVRDNAGASASTSATVQVVPAADYQLRPALVDLSFFQTVMPGNVHNNLEPWDGPPTVGAALTAQVTLSGAVATPQFSLRDSSGQVLGTATFARGGDPWLQPQTFTGPVTIPSVPFSVVASGTSADGKPYSLASAPITPMNMALSFDPPQLMLAPTASRALSLRVRNGGDSATFTVTFSDPGKLLASAASQSLSVAAGQSATLPLTITLSAAERPLNPVLRATAAVTGDPSRSGTATLQVWRSP